MAGVVVLSIGVDETRQTAVNWRDAYDLTSPVLVDSNSEIYESFALGLFPLNVILDDEFVVQYQEIHFNEFEIRTLLSDLSDPLVIINHTSRENVENSGSDYQIESEIRQNSGSAITSAAVFWKTEPESEFHTTAMTPVSDDRFTSDIPAQATGTIIEYYLYAETQGDSQSFHPGGAPELPHRFLVLEDRTAPAISHVPITRWRRDLWSPEIRVSITDDLDINSTTLEFRINGGDLQTVPMSPHGELTWRAWFTHAVALGDLVEYRVSATDTAILPNTSHIPVTGFYTIEIIDPIPVLVLDLDGNRNSGPVIRDTMFSLGISVEYQTFWPDYLENYESLWIAMGVYPDNYLLSFEENTTLDAAIKNGLNVYLECGNCWQNRDRYNSLNQFGIRTTGDDVDSLSSVKGITDTLTDGMEFEYVGDSQILNRLAPGNGSTPILQSKTPEFFIGMASTGNYSSSVGMSSELGGLTNGDAPGMVRDLVTQIASFLGVIDTPFCEGQRVTISMPSDYYSPGDLFSCTVTPCSPVTLKDTPLFVILDVYGELYFWPSFSEFDFQSMTIDPIQLPIEVIPEFLWPDNAGTAHSLVWYAGLTDSYFTTILGQFDVLEFGYGE